MNQRQSKESWSIKRALVLFVAKRLPHLSCVAILILLHGKHWCMAATLRDFKPILQLAGQSLTELPYVRIYYHWSCRSEFTHKKIGQNSAEY